MPSRVWVSVLTVSLLFGGCDTTGDYFFVERTGAVMPVWVRGNVASGTFIVMLHGGPGDTAQGYLNFPSFQALEARYAVVYWDQRGSGTSQGRPAKQTYTVNEAVEDTDAVLTVLRARYQPAHVFLLGHSWGGFLGTAYLLDPAHQAGVTGYLMVDGAYDIVHGFDLSRQFVLEHARQQVAQGIDLDLWRSAVDWASAPLPTSLSVDVLKQLSSYVYQAGGYTWQLPDLPLDLHFALLTPFDTFQYFANAASGALTSYDLAGLDPSVE